MAETEAEKFISANEFGLYRGEVMLTIGLCWLDVFTEPEKAEKWLQRSADWFEKVSRQAPPVNPPVPEKSQQVSHASDNPRYQDEWTNVRDTQIQPGQLFNRRDCPWYLTKYWAQSVTKLGLIAFAKQDFDKAKKFWESLYDIDPYFHQKDEDDEQHIRYGTSYVKRLLWNIEHNKGALYATPEEMAVFKDLKSRWLLLNADIEMELENHPEAERKFRKLLQNKHILSNKEQAAYCTYALAEALQIQATADDTSFYPLFDKFLPGKEFGNCVIVPRALSAYAYLLTERHEKDQFDKGMKLYKHVFTTYPKTVYAEACFLNYAICYSEYIDRDKGQDLLKEFPTRFPDGELRETAESYFKMWSEPDEEEDSDEESEEEPADE